MKTAQGDVSPERKLLSFGGQKQGRGYEKEEDMKTEKKNKWREK